MVFDVLAVYCIDSYGSRYGLFRRFRRKKTAEMDASNGQTIIDLNK